MTRRLRLLAHAIDYTPESAAAGSRTSAVVDWLVRRGHSLSIVAGSGETARRRSMSSAKTGLRVLRSPVAAAPVPDGLARRMQHVSFAVASAPTLLAEANSFRPDLIAALTPSASSASAAIAAARIAGVPAWLHLEETAPTLGVEPAFTCVSLASLDADEELARRGVAPADALSLAPWVDTRAIARSDEPGPLRAAFTRSPDDIVALYVGSCADERAAQILIDAARRVPVWGAVLIVAAVKGPASRLLAAAASELPRLRLLRLPQPHELGELLGAADIHLLPMGIDADEPLLPAKFASLLASGRPIVASAPNVAAPHAFADAVTMTSPTGEAIAAAVVDLAAHPAERRERGLAARRAAEDYFAMERVLRRLENRLLAVAACAAQ